MLCSVDGCNLKAEKRGWCCKHYQRWLRNKQDPSILLRTENGEPMRFLREVVVPHVGKRCLTWPYGSVYYHCRLACRMVHGKKPSKKHEVAHSCGRGHLKCINPSHLRWSTHSDNERDKLKHGTSPRGKPRPKGQGTNQWCSKLTEKDVRKIRKSLGVLPIAEVAQQFKVTRANIRAIQQRKSWRWLS